MDNLPDKPALKFSFSKPAPKPGLSSSLAKRPSGQSTKTVAKPKPKPKLGLGSDDESTEPAAAGSDSGKRGSGGNNNKRDVLIIPPQRNRDWRDDARAKRQTGPIPGEQKDDPNWEPPTDTTPKIGLTVIQKDSSDGDRDPSGHNTSDDGQARESLTDEQRAIMALQGADTRTTSNLVVPLAVAEEAAFKRDYADAPDAPSLEQYDAVPVEEFGAAMLRGMGWTDGAPIGRRWGDTPKTAPTQTKQGANAEVTVVKPRPALLGIGATADSVVAAAKAGKAPDKASRKAVREVYTPVILRNKRTGETVTEDELREREKAKERGRDGDGRREPEGRPSERESDRRSERRSERQPRDGRGESDRDRRDSDRDRDRRDRDRDSGRDSGRHRSRNDRDRDSDRNRDRPRDDRDRRRDRSSDRHRSRR